MKTLFRALYICLATLLLVPLATPCYAMRQPAIKPVDSMEAFLEEYGRGSNFADAREYFAPAPLLCIGDVALTGGGGRVDLVAPGGVRVTDGAVVYWDDPGLIIMGNPPCIKVEHGGALRIRRWHPNMANMISTGMIQVETGGVLQVAEDLALPDGMVIVEAGGIFQKVDMPPPSATPTPTPTPTPDPAPDPNPMPEPTPKPLPLTITQWQRKSDRLALWFETTPCGLIEEDIKSIEIYHSRDGSAWQLRQTLKWDEKYDGLVPEAENAHFRIRLGGGPAGGSNRGIRRTGFPIPKRNSASAILRAPISGAAFG